MIVLRHAEIGRPFVGACPLHTLHFVNQRTDYCKENIILCRFRKGNVEVEVSTQEPLRQLNALLHDLDSLFHLR